MTQDFYSQSFTFQLKGQSSERANVAGFGDLRSEYHEGWLGEGVIFDHVARDTIHFGQIFCIRFQVVEPFAAQVDCRTILNQIAILKTSLRIWKDNYIIKLKVTKDRMI